MYNYGQFNNIAISIYIYLAMALLVDLPEMNMVTFNAALIPFKSSQTCIIVA